jgi:hypothetical protein
MPVNLWLHRSKNVVILKNWPLEGLCGGCLQYLSHAQNPIPLPPSYTLYMCIQYTYLFTQGSGGELNQREGVRGNSSQSWVENTKMKNDLQSINSAKHSPVYKFC